jgi:hypothetical protein
MTKEEKITILKLFTSGRITKSEMILRFKNSDLKIVSWNEVHGGLFKSEETGHLLPRSEIEALNIYNQVNVLVKGFHDDGTPIPDLAFSE